MPRIQNVSPEELAKLFHHYHEALAPDFGCGQTREASPFWELTPPNERKLLVATARLVLLDLGATRGDTSVTVRESIGDDRLGVRLGKDGQECGC
jgi:hypothetical protein